MAYATLICAYSPCHRPFDVLPYQTTSLKYCSPTCYHAARKARNTVDMCIIRFWAKVDKTPGHGPQGECWLWTGATHANGYGNFRATPHKSGNMSAHIVSWFLQTGAWPPDGLFVCHTCDFKTCIRPDHLFLGTHSDNMQDAIRKGRNGMVTHPERAIEGTRRWNLAHPERPQTAGDRNGMRLHPESVLRGDRNHQTKLTEAQLEEAIALYAQGPWTLAQLGTRYSVTAAAVGARIRKHKLSTKRDQ